MVFNLAIYFCASFGLIFDPPHIYYGALKPLSLSRDISLQILISFVIAA